MHITIFYIIVGILIFDFLLERLLDYLNSSKINTEVPEELKGIYDDEKYAKQQSYKKENDRFSFLTSSFSIVVMMLMLFLGGFDYVNRLSVNIVDHYILTSLLFFGVLMFASDIINIPFSIYNIFVIEEKYGFNKTTIKTYIFDKLKGWVLMSLIGGGILSVIIWFYGETAEYFWLYAWGLVTVFLIFTTMFYSTLIVPLFNKQKPLEEGPLRDAIQDFCGKAGFKLDNLFVIDGSKRSTKANAYFSGLGAKKRIVLYDTLINDLEVDEIVAVLAHEIGHYKKKHTLQGILLSIIQTGITLYILSMFIGNVNFSKALVPDTTLPIFHIGLITFGVLYSPISTILSLGMNMLSRKNEYEADRYAASFNCSEHLQSALKKLYVNTLSNLTPHKAYVFFHYSHPPLLERLRGLKKVLI